MVSNGYVVIGGGTSTDVQFLNQDFPDADRPNNVLAPFWTDLDLTKGGAVRVGTLTDGVDTWIVVDWAAARVYTAADTQANSFQVWIRVGTEEDVTYTYGPVGAGDGGFLTVGAENLYGNRGQSYYYNGTGTAPVEDTELSVASTPGAPGETHEITFEAVARRRGEWVNCAELTSDTVFGITTSCVPGQVVKP